MLSFPCCSEGLGSRARYNQGHQPGGLEAALGLHQKKSILNSCLCWCLRGVVLDPLFNISGPKSDQENLHWVEVRLLPTEAP